ncbi:MAG: DUF7133 domain-containing protein [Verrucomicrobiia bacterium]
MNIRRYGAINKNAAFPAVLCLVFVLITSGFGAIRLENIPLHLVRLATGFRIVPVAQPAICGDVRSIAFDERGRLFVATSADIRILVDTNRDGVFDAFTIFSDFRSRGKIFSDGFSLYAFSQPSLYRLVDENGDGILDVQPQKLFDLEGNDAFISQLKRGADGWWYATLSRNAGLDNIRIGGFPLIFKKDCGALVRFTPDFVAAQIFATGFYNPIAFDFNGYGEIFVCDGGADESILVPHKSGARIIKAKNGWHYGWTESGGEPISKANYYFDVGAALEELGVATPSSLVVYQHKQFPDYFHNGLFVALWSSGKILFFPSINGEVAASELFLDSYPDNDFAPVDMAVAPDGSLFIATGGAKTSPRIFRIDYLLAQKKPTEAVENLSPLLRALNAPQPFDAWSRVVWTSEAQKAGFNAFSMVIGSEIYTPEQRIRAIDIKMELFDGLTLREVRAASRAVSPAVRRKIAQALQFDAVLESQDVLGQLATDPEPAVRAAALDAINAQFGSFKRIPLLPIILPNLAHPDRETRLAAARLAARLDEYEWKKYLPTATNASALSQLSAAMSMAFRKKGVNTELVNLALNILVKSQDNQAKLDALRLIILGIGDFPPSEHTSDIGVAFEPNSEQKEISAVSNCVLATLKPFFPNANPAISYELARLFAMLQDNDQRLPSLFVNLINRQSPLESDMFFLSALAALPPPRRAYEPPPTATALLTTLGKYNNLPYTIKPKTDNYLDYLISTLLKNDPSLDEQLLKNPMFLKDGLTIVAPLLALPRQQQALKLFFNSQARGYNKVSQQLINWLGGFTNDAVWLFFQSQWTNRALQDDILIHLSNFARPQDREKFIQGLNSHRPDVILACIEALLKLPPDTSAAAQLRVLQLLRRLVRDPEQKPLREKTIQLLSRYTNTPFLIQEISSDPQNLLKIYDPIFIRFVNLYPTFAPLLDGEQDAEAFRILNLTRAVRPPIGDPQRGYQVFVRRRCATCHNPVSEFAPSLSEFTSKMPIQFLTQEIIFPNQRLNKAYNMQLFTLKNGQKIVAIGRFLGGDFCYLQSTPTNTIRIAAANIDYIQKFNQSVMPPGLLNGITAQELSDLCAFIKQAK